MNIGEFRSLVERGGIAWIDLQFTDVPGKMHHITVSARRLDENAFSRGIGKLDGSSIKGFKDIEESDLVLVPDPNTFSKIPWMENMKYGRFICKIYDTLGRGRLVTDPRYISERADEYLRDKGWKVYWGPEPEFFVFERVEVDVMNPYAGQSYRIYSAEAPWSGDALTIKFKEGYYPVPPLDKMFELRAKIVEIAEKYFGLKVESHHHEVATAGQGEVNFEYSGTMETADRVQTIKYVVKNVAKEEGMVATFMPKPVYGDNGNGMHVHQSVWDNDKNLFYDPDDDYAELSQLGRYYVGGLLEHARALSAIASPTVNSYKRLVPGYEAPIYLVWSRGNRSAAVRVPVYHKQDSMKRVEYRPPDPSANPYLLLPALLAAGLDGIKKKIDPGDSVDENVYKMGEERRRQMGIKTLPRDLWEALDELESDMEFLRVFFPKELLERYIELKRSEYREISNYTTPIEIYKYLEV